MIGIFELRNNRDSKDFTVLHANFYDVGACKLVNSTIIKKSLRIVLSDKKREIRIAILQICKEKL